MYNVKSSHLNWCTHFQLVESIGLNQGVASGVRNPSGVAKSSSGSSLELPNNPAHYKGSFIYIFLIELGVVNKFIIASASGSFLY